MELVFQPLGTYYKCMDAKDYCATLGQLNYSLSLRSEIFNFIGCGFSSRLINASWLKKIWIFIIQRVKPPNWTVYLQTIK